MMNDFIVCTWDLSMHHSHNSTYDDGMGFKEWMDAYGLWKQVEHYSNSTNECFAVDSRNKRLPGWRCRDRVFILRLAP